MIFFCFSSKDRITIVEAILFHITNYELPVWYDRYKMLMGDERDYKNFEEGVGGCKYAIIIVSPNAIESICAQEEIELIYRRYIKGDMTVFPIFYNIKANELPEKLRWMTQLVSRAYRKESPMLSQTLEYIDRRTGVKSQLVMRDLVFINFRTGMPNKNSSYDTHLYKLCDEAGIKRFCMHALRHTYATRAIESGMQPKVLQKLLGHASIKTTMDRYVHVTDDSMANAVRQFESHQGA